MEVLENEDSMKKLWEKIKTIKNNTKLQRIMTLCIMAKVDFEEYVKALSISNKGYSAV